MPTGRLNFCRFDCLVSKLVQQALALADAERGVVSLAKIGRECSTAPSSAMQAELGGTTVEIPSQGCPLAGVQHRGAARSNAIAKTV